MKNTERRFESALNPQWIKANIFTTAGDYLGVRPANMDKDTSQSLFTFSIDNGVTLTSIPMPTVTKIEIYADEGD